MPSLYTRRPACDPRLTDVLAGGSLRTAFQPIVDLRDRTVRGMEALLRIERDGSWLPPSHSFARAAAAGLTLELELAAVAVALSRLDDVPSGSFLAVNAGPATILAPAFTALLDGLDLPRVVVEITEHECISDYEPLHRVFRRLRRRGLRIAVDDTGAGSSSLRHIVRLRPDVVKLDVSLVDRVCTDPVQRALVSALVGFTSDIGSLLVTEGIEDPRQVPVLRDLGVLVGQGFALGVPAPLDPRV